MERSYSFEQEKDQKVSSHQNAPTDHNIISAHMKQFDDCKVGEIVLFRLGMLTCGFDSQIRKMSYFERQYFSNDTCISASVLDKSDSLVTLKVTHFNTTFCLTVSQYCANIVTESSNFTTLTESSLIQLQQSSSENDNALYNKIKQFLSTTSARQFTDETTNPPVLQSVNTSSERTTNSRKPDDQPSPSPLSVLRQSINETSTDKGDAQCESDATFESDGHSTTNSPNSSYNTNSVSNSSSILHEKEDDDIHWRDSPFEIMNTNRTASNANSTTSNTINSITETTVDTQQLTNKNSVSKERSVSQNFKSKRDAATPQNYNTKFMKTQIGENVLITLKIIMERNEWLTASQNNSTEWLNGACIAAQIIQKTNNFAVLKVAHFNTQIQLTAVEFYSGVKSFVRDNKALVFTEQYLLDIQNSQLVHEIQQYAFISDILTRSPREVNNLRNNTKMNISHQHIKNNTTNNIDNSSIKYGQLERSRPAAITNIKSNSNNTSNHDRNNNTLNYSVDNINSNNSSNNSCNNSGNNSIVDTMNNIEWMDEPTLTAADTNSVPSSITTDTDNHHQIDTISNQTVVMHTTNNNNNDTTNNTNNTRHSKHANNVNNNNTTSPFKFRRNNQLSEAHVNQNVGFYLRGLISKTDLKKLTPDCILFIKLQYIACKIISINTNSAVLKADHFDMLFCIDTEMFHKNVYIIPHNVTQDFLRTTVLTAERLHLMSTTHTNEYKMIGKIVTQTTTVVHEKLTSDSNLDLVVQLLYESLDFLIAQKSNIDNTNNTSSNTTNNTNSVQNNMTNFNYTDNNTNSAQNNTNNNNTVTSPFTTWMANNTHNDNHYNTNANSINNTNNIINTISSTNNANLSISNQIANYQVQNNKDRGFSNLKRALPGEFNTTATQLTQQAQKQQKISTSQQITQMKPLTTTQQKPLPVSVIAAQNNPFFIKTRVGDRIGYQLRGFATKNQGVRKVVKMTPNFYLQNGIACEVVMKTFQFVVLKVDHFDTFLYSSAANFCDNVPRSGFVGVVFNAELLQKMSKSHTSSEFCAKYNAIKVMLETTNKKTEFPLPPQQITTQTQSTSNPQGMTINGVYFTRIAQSPELKRKVLSESEFNEVVRQCREDVSDEEVEEVDQKEEERMVIEEAVDADMV